MLPFISSSPQHKSSIFMEVLLPLNKLYKQICCLTQLLPQGQCNSAPCPEEWDPQIFNLVKKVRLHPGKGKWVFTLQAVLPQRLLIYWKQYFMLDFLSHIHRATTAGYRPLTLTALKM